MDPTFAPVRNFLTKLFVIQRVQKSSFSIMRMFQIFIIILCLSAVLVSAEVGCPYPEEIEPCTCDGDTDVLECHKVHDTQLLLRVFENSRRFHFNKFTLSESSLQYIPHQIFDDVEVDIFYMENVTLRNLFDEVPRDPGIVDMRATGVKILGGWDWKKLADFKKLQVLALWDVPLRKLTADFRNSVKELWAIQLENCELKQLQDDEFADFTFLIWIILPRNAIANIKRTMFPRSIGAINFDYNRISTVPDDLFSDMPFLYAVSLKGNLLAVLPEDTFKPVISQLRYLDVRGNPIKCDCRIAWVLEEKRGKIDGNCFAPKALRDKPFDQLTRKDIRCEMSSNSIL